MTSIARTHLDHVNESYWQHFRKATGFGLRMLVGGIACLLHGINPAWCVRTGSETIVHLHTAMVTDRIAQEKTKTGSDRNS